MAIAIIVVIVVVFILYSLGSKQSETKPIDNRKINISRSKSKEPGMYFMYCYEDSERKRKETGDDLYGYSDRKSVV